MNSTLDTKIISAGPKKNDLANFAPNVREPLNRPSHQIGHLSIAYLDNALNAVCTERHVYAKKWAWNRFRAVGTGSVMAAPA